MAVVTEGQKQTFEDRLGRIAKGGPNTKGTIYMGAVESDGHAIQPGKKGSGVFGFLGNTLMLPIAFLFGGLALLAGRVGLYQLAARPELIPPDYAGLVLLWGDLVLGLLLMFIFAATLRMGRGLRKYMLAFGFLGVMLAEPMLIQQAPDLFVPLFSETYVEQAMMATAPLEHLPEMMETARTLLADAMG